MARFNLDDLPPGHRQSAAQQLGLRQSDAGTPRTRTAPRRDLEHAEQVALVQWVELTHPLLHEHMTAVPHGGGRSPAEAGRLRAEGVRAGYPDLLFDLPRGPWHGLRIEMKAEAGRVSSEQERWLARLAAAGFRAVVCRGAAAAMEEVAGYWKLGPYRPPTLPAQR